MVKYKLFIAIHYLEIGGAETSLIGLLQSLDYNKVDVDLFVYSHQGPLMKAIPAEVNLLPEKPEYVLTERSASYSFKRGYYKIAFALLKARIRLSYYVRTKHPKDFSAFFGYMGDSLSPVIPSMSDKEYDMAISFMVPHNYVLDHVIAKKKICWIHTDYTQIDINKRLEYPVWNAYDNIVSISDDVTKTFIKVFPDFACKIIKIENILCPRYVLDRSEEFYPKEYGLFRSRNMKILCSAGRICEPKNFECIPFVVKELIQTTTNFHWIIIGPGESEHIVESARILGVEKYISFIGPRENPYPYIKNCDLYIQPSLYEGKSVVVREAQILKKPIIITNYPTASSQIINGKDGIIVNLDNKSIAKGILTLLHDKDKQDNIIEYLSNHNYGNDNEVEKLYYLLQRP